MKTGENGGYMEHRGVNSRVSTYGSPTAVYVKERHDRDTDKAFHPNRDEVRSPFSPIGGETHELELLVLDLAKALPNPDSLRLAQSHFSPRPYSQSASWSDAGDSFETRSSLGGQQSLAAAAVRDATQTSVETKGQPLGSTAPAAAASAHSSAASATSGSSSGAIGATASTSKEGHEVLANYYRLYDVDRETRVARAIQMAEAERARRMQEHLNDKYQEKLERARRLEWAIKATEAERQRQTRRDKAYERRVNRRRRVLKEWTIRQEEVERDRRIKRGAGADIVLREARRRIRAEASRARRARRESSLGGNGEGVAKSSPALLPSNVRKQESLSAGADLADSSEANYLSEADLDSDLDSMSSFSDDSDDGYSPYVDDYEVVCPYTILGCGTTCLRSELDEHLSICDFRASARDVVDDHESNDDINMLYNPLDCVVTCPYRVMGCEHECSRAMLPEHLVHCAFHDDDTGPIDLDRFNLATISRSGVDMERYEIVCPYSIMGCTDIILRSEYSAHLAVCPFAPVTRQQEEADRIKNMEMAIEAAEDERKRRLTLSEEDNERMRSQHFTRLVRALIEARLITLEREEDEEASSLDAVSPGSHRLGTVTAALGALSTSAASTASIGNAQSLTSLEPSWPSESLRRESSFDSARGRDSLINSKNVKWIFKAAEIEALRQKVELRALERAMGGGGSGSARRKGFVLPLRRIRSSPAMLSYGEARSQDSPPRIAETRDRTSSSETSMDNSSRTRPSTPARELTRSNSFKLLRDRGMSISSLKSTSVGNPLASLAQAAAGAGMSFDAVMRASRSRRSTASSVDASPAIRQRFSSRASELSGDTANTSTSSVVSLTTESTGMPVWPTTRHHRSRSLGYQGPGLHVQGFGLDGDNGEPWGGSSRGKTQRAMSSESGVHGSMPESSLHDHMDDQMRNLHRRLRIELQEYADACTKENVSYESTIADIRSKIEHEASLCFGHGSRAELFGSYASGLAVPGLSDLDLVLITSHGRLDVNGANICNILGRVLRHKNWLSDIKILDRAKMPVVKLKTNPEVVGRAVNVDLTIALPSHAGLHAAGHIRRLVQHHEQLRPIVLTLKRFLAERGLHDPFSGGLSSYALVLMVVASLNRSVDRRLWRARRRSEDFGARSPSTSELGLSLGGMLEGAMSGGTAATAQHASSRLSLGLLLMDLLQFFGREFNPSQDAILVDYTTAGNERQTMRIGERSRAGTAAPSGGDYTALLVVEDPVQTGNNVGRTCFRFAEVQYAFKELYAKLLSFTVRCEAIKLNSPSKRGILERFIFAK
ncbi:PolyA RNA polymerase cid14 [Hondaea fermentalgiana]|uniref:PolyA RNA polymerase cid14 n=1 Tax=Hondaea fermentalgiana TaxID=2315210 RepID=A0A2R5G960_9STRA|nr:PolyA RNA polymerase cid14 [Hondaea fermentalgiana]|eukprot:GBG27075.1 PolyA RNA polymerase cid14 [Hondaea fermentalgiana]